MTLKLHCKLQICIGQWSFNCGNSEMQYIFYKIKKMRCLKSCAESTGLTVLHRSDTNSENFHFLIKILISNAIFCTANSLLTFYLPLRLLRGNMSQHRIFPCIQFVFCCISIVYTV